MPAAPDTVKSIFLAALELPPAERSTFLIHACQGDDDLRHRVEALLQAGEAPDSLLDRPAAEHLDASPNPLPDRTPLPDDAALGRLAEPNRAGRFRLLEEIARGGMGAVLRAHDPEMDRAVAVKIALPEYRNDPSLTHRFFAEARLAGQLQHPGVVPIYDFGRLADGRPFFAMKLIEGRTLARLLRERPDPGHDLPRFLRYFEAVCQAVGYAHSRGVIHRDLKPANVMVGAFGEVQVMDWGLAKELQIADRRSQIDSENLQSAICNLQSAKTRPGCAMGTPAYIAPEQAAGEVDHLDERSDVFGLGAILCEVLTGQPPYVGKDALEVQQLAAHAELADACGRLAACGADAELVGLALACLAPKPDARPRDARVLAAALTAHLDGVQARLRKAELAEAEAKARALGEAKRRRLALALAGTILVAVALGAGGALWFQADRQVRQAERASAINDALNQAALLREKAAATADSARLFAQAREQVQRALALVQTGPADAVLTARAQQLQQAFDEEEKNRQFLASLDAARLTGAETLVGENRFARERAIPRYRDAFRVFGMEIGLGEPGAFAAQLSRLPPAVREAAFTALVDWFDVVSLRDYQVNEPHPDWLRAVATALADEGLPQQLRDAYLKIDREEQLAALQKLAATADVGKLPPTTLLRLAERLLDAHATPNGLDLLRRAQKQYPDDFWLNNSLGYYLANTEPQRWEEAMRYLTAAVALRPKSPGAHVNLAVALYTTGQLDEALNCCHKAIALDPNYTVAYVNGAEVLRAKGRVDEAIDWCRKALAVDSKLAWAHGTLGSALMDKGRVDEALDCYRKASALDPEHAWPHMSLGAILCDVKHDYDGALASFRQVIALEPKNGRAQVCMGHALVGKGQVDAAIACYRKAIEVEPNLVQGHTSLGRIFCDVTRNYSEAVACFRRAVTLDAKNAGSHYSLGNALSGLRQVDEAITCYRRAIELDPSYAEAHCNLAGVLAKKGEFHAALASYRTGHQLGSRQKGWRYRSADWVKQCERWVQLDDLQVAIRMGEARPAGPAEYLELADFCRDLKQCPATAVRFYGQAFNAEPKLATDLPAGNRYHAALAAICAGCGQGNDAAGLSVAARAQLRQQALDWLHADLTFWSKQRETETSEARQTTSARMQEWLSEPNLAGVRDPPGLAELPAKERHQWQALWVEVTTARK
jgi:serine/threonine-protein kinase